MAAEKHFITASEAAQLWGISSRRVRVLCATYRVFGAVRNRQTGVWSIPANTTRPMDGRFYRYNTVPYHFRNLVNWVDRAHERMMAAPPIRTTEDSWKYFCCGSAYHLHRLSRGNLAIKDILKVLAGEHLEQKPRREQHEVLCHVAALECIRTAVKQHRPLTMTLVCEIYRCLMGIKRIRGLKGKKEFIVFEAVFRHITHENTHPIVKAGNVLVEFHLHQPFPAENERLGYMIANFILLKSGYPPMILYRALFKAKQRYTCEHQRRVAENLKRGYREGMVPPITEREAFLNGCVIRAVRLSCILGIRPITKRM